MDLGFTEDQEMLKTMARDFLTTECPKTLVREIEESELGYSPELWRKMGEQGWMGLLLPEKYGGAEAEWMSLILLLQEMGHNVTPSPYFSTVVLCGLPILAAGTEEQKDEFLTKICNGEIIMALAWTEPTAVYTPDGINTRAVADGDDYVISGTKLFVDDAAVADYLLCVTRTKDGATPEEGITLFLVDAKSSGVTRNPQVTIAMNQQCQVIFDKVRVPKKSILGELDNGWPIMQRLWDQAMVCECARMVGGMEYVQEITLEYAKTRVQYGRPIGGFQVIAHYCADMWGDVETSRNITYDAAWHVGENDDEAHVRATIAKAWISDTYLRVTQKGVHIHGAIGMTRDHDMGLYYRRAKVYEETFGAADFHRAELAHLMNF